MTQKREEKKNMNLKILTPELMAALDAVTTAFQKVAEMLKEFTDNMEDAFKKPEIMECVEFSKKKKYTPCRKIGLQPTPQISAKLWRKIGLCLGHTREVFNSQIKSQRSFWL